MDNVHAIVDLVAKRQDREQFRRKNWVGTFDEYLDLVRENPQVTRTAYQRLYDMILSYGVETVETRREKTRPLQVLRRSGRRRARRHLRSATAADEPGQRLQERRQGLRHRAPGAAAARPGGEQQEHHRPAAEEGPGALLAPPTRARSTRWAGWTRQPDDPAKIQWCPMHEEPLHLIPTRFRQEVEEKLNEGRGEGDYLVHDRRRPRPLLPVHLPAAAQEVRRRLDPAWCRTSASSG